jgi:hypothetical protein
MYTNASDHSEFSTSALAIMLFHYLTSNQGNKAFPAFPGQKSSISTSWLEIKHLTKLSTS